MASFIKGVLTLHANKILKKAKFYLKNANFSKQAVALKIKIFKKQGSHIFTVNSESNEMHLELKTFILRKKVHFYLLSASRKILRSTAEFCDIFVNLDDFLCLLHRIQGFILLILLQRGAAIFKQNISVFEV